MGGLFRERWPLRPLFTFAALVTIISGSIISQFPRFLEKGGGAVLCMFAIVLFAYILPILFIEVSLGHFLKGPVCLFGKLPIFQGIGWGMVTFSLISSTYRSVDAGLQGYYFYKSQHTQISKIHSCYADEGGRRPCTAQTNNLNLSYEWAMERYYQTKFDPSTPVYFTNPRAKIQNPDAVGDINLTLIIFAAIVWGIVFFCILLGPLTLGFTSFLQFVGALGLLFAILAKGFKLPGAKTGVDQLFSNDWDAIRDYDRWKQVIMYTVEKTWLGTGIFMTLSGFNKRNSWKWMFLEVPFILVAFLVANAIGAIIFGCATGHGMVVLNYAHGFGSFVDHFSNFHYTFIQFILWKSKTSDQWFYVYYALIFILNISTLCTLVEVVNTAFIHTAENTCGPRPRTKFRPLLAIGIIAMLFGISVLFCTTHGLQSQRFVENYLFTFIPTYIFATITAFGVWQMSRIWGSLHRSVCARLSLILFLVIPFVFLALAATTYLQYLYVQRGLDQLNRADKTRPYWWLGALVAFVPVIVTIIVSTLHAITTCCRAVANDEPPCQTLCCGYADESLYNDDEDDGDESFEMNGLLKY